MKPLQQALAYSEAGVSVFPCNPKTKAPLVANGYKAATTNPDTIDAWWSANPDALVGCPCGENGFFAVDLDVRNDLNGIRAWYDLNSQQETPAIPAISQNTPSGGVHHLFALPADRPIKNSASKLGAGIDVRGGNGYIILYECKAGWRLKEAPDWLLELISGNSSSPDVNLNSRSSGKARFPEGTLLSKSNGDTPRLIFSGGTPYGMTALENEIARIEAAPEGTRNDTLNSASFSVGQLIAGGELEADKAVSELHRAASKLSADDGRESTLLTIKSGVEAGMQQPRKAPEASTLIARTTEKPLVSTDYFPTDIGNAELFRDLCQDHIRYDHKRSRWLLWKNHRWHQDCEHEIILLAMDTARQRLVDAAKIQDENARKAAVRFAFASENNNRLNATLNLVRNFPPIADTEDWDTNLYLLGCSNGVVDLRTGFLRDGQPADRLTLSTNIEYHPEAGCPRWEQFLLELFDGDLDMVRFIQRAIGYSLTGDTREQCLFLCWGSGANGKSTMLNVMRNMLGQYAANTPFSTFELQFRNSNTNDLASLADVRLVSAAETNDARRLNESRVKVATGSDPITARYLYRENFTYIPQFKIWLAMNSKPTIKGTDDGIWRRIRLIPYTVSFQDTADQTLEQQLRAEHSGILAWAVRGAIDWFDRGLQPPQKVLDATAEYRTESDHIARFLDDCVVVDGNEKIKASALYNRYGRWCDVYNEKPINNTAFGLRMVAEGYEKQKAKYVFYMGIKLNGR